MHLLRITIALIGLLWIPEALCQTASKPSKAIDDFGTLILPDGLKKNEKAPLFVVLPGREPSMFPELKSLAESWRYAVWTPSKLLGPAYRPDDKSPITPSLRCDPESINRYVKKLIEAYPVDSKVIIVLGYSEGASMGFQCAILDPELYRGLIAFNGALEKELWEEGHLANVKLMPPVYFVHGEQNEKIPFKWGRETCDALKKAGFPVSLQKFQGGHTLPPRFTFVVKDAMDWISSQSKSESISYLEKILTSQLPVSYKTRVIGRFVIASNSKLEEVDSVVDALERTSKRVETVIGKDPDRRNDPIGVYYFNSTIEFDLQYRKLMGRAPGLAGCMQYSPTRLFGSTDVGDGTIAHELVHAMIYEDWPNPPGWFNESLAVTLGCPVVKVAFSNNFQILDLHLWAGLQAIQQKKWTTINQMFMNPTPDYTTLDKELLKIPMVVDGKVSVGPLLTGRLFVRWLAETGKLSAFYQRFRELKDPDKAVRATFSKTTDQVEKDLLNWILNHDEKKLIKQGETP